MQSISFKNIRHAHSHTGYQIKRFTHERQEKREDEEKEEKKTKLNAFAFCILSKDLLCLWGIAIIQTY